MFPINKVKPGVPHVKVDMINDLFCVSSNGQDPHFRDQRFTGAVSLYHKILKVRNMRHNARLRIQADKPQDMHRICMGLPNYDLAAQGYGCQDCGKNYQDEPLAFPNDSIEFCLRCMGLWFACLKNLEQVYIIVPGLPRARKTDRHHIFRYGEARTVVRAIISAAQNDPTAEFRGTYFAPVSTDRFTGVMHGWLTLPCNKYSLTSRKDR